MPEIMVLNKKYTVKGMTYHEYLGLAKQVVSKNVSPIPHDDFSTLQLFMIVMQLTAQMMDETARSLIRSVVEKPKGVI